MDAEMTMLECDEAMTKAVEHAIHEFATVRTGKASPTLVENMDVHVHSYGSHMKMKQLAMITTPDARLIRIEPFDPGTLQDIDRAIRESKLGLNGSIEGKVIRLPIPALSQERREQMVKMCKQLGEEARVRVRSARRHALEALKAGEKDGSITEDDLRRLEKDVQTMTDKKIAEIDQHVISKEKEILTV
ncbi:MAG: ribosome recycling factor [Verrucomicrobiaceae bacterium]|jgi:ribosome recycling factor|nr:ribosome recycling factor [Verrucomicrobiaceae bacterium]